ncbi:nucleotidyl transferase AbiEii/AbiGii toxin family protein [Umezawaea beigongshangensis]|uniref:nucleotidyl transferase AbiEii/AbiGii toxin family protein n=1 Tax=Umezawaea beigongshangensis TaxID=2780383 RepID=UPI0018F16EF5|nr:nucleotidyl transferase AbiEii/AbiGii toxin family protein [Umezawaea beigongshangensis]
MFSGDFEVHLTGSEWKGDELAAFAGRHGAKFSHIRLDRGATPSQPMLTVSGSGTLAQLRELAARWRTDLEAAGLEVLRVKIEAAPWNEGVPSSDEDARDDLYFEHHVKVLLPTGDLRTMAALDSAIHEHAARASRNARRTRDDAHEERFVTQRCRGVGRSTARGRLDALLAALRDGGFAVLEVEEEYVVHDDALHVDRGWLEAGPLGHRRVREEQRLLAPSAEGGDYPSTYRPLAVTPERGVRQEVVFDPALKHFDRAFRTGEPVFDDAAEGERWRTARRAAMTHVLAVVAASSWAGHLVLRGSVVLRAWLGDTAREPGDLDFVVVPHTVDSDGEETRAMLEGLVAAVAADPGPGLRADQVVSEHIWTYERVPGRRLVFPFDVDGLPGGAVQVDLVFGEHLPEEPIAVEVPRVGRPMLAATPSLSLAWKLQWLMTDSYPQGKDLYDAVLLAEHTTVPLALARDLMRPELGALADEFTARSVLSLTVDWDNFRGEHPGVEGDATSWLHRLAAALG